MNEFDSRHNKSGGRQAGDLLRMIRGPGELEGHLLSRRQKGSYLSHPFQAYRPIVLSAPVSKSDTYDQIFGQTQRVGGA